LSGNLLVGSNNIEFSFLINREAKLVIRENGVDARSKKSINVALPTLATDAASKIYVDSKIQQSQATAQDRL